MFLPAVWLNALGNVYIIHKQDQNCKTTAELSKIATATSITSCISGR